MSSTDAQVEAHVLGHPKHGGSEDKEGQLAACPLSHRVLLLLEEKEVPYSCFYVSKEHKPEWVGKVNPQGTLPILKDLKSRQWVPDSDAISDYLEDKFPAEQGGAKALGRLADCPVPAPDLWKRFYACLGAKGEGERQRAQHALREALQEVEGLVSNERPYLGGKEVNAADVAVVPRLYLAREGLRHFQDWDWTDEFPNIKDYLHRWTGRPSWRNTASWDYESIAADLSSHAAAQ